MSARLRPPSRSVLPALLLAALSAPAHASFLAGAYAGQAGDPAEARRQYEITAKLGHVESQLRLGRMLAHGTGGAVDPDAARAWLSAAALAGNAEAREALGESGLAPLAPDDPAFIATSGQSVAPAVARSLARTYWLQQDSHDDQVLRLDGFRELFALVGLFSNPPEGTARGIAIYEFEVLDSGYITDVAVLLGTGPEEFARRLPGVVHRAIAEPARRGAKGPPPGRWTSEWSIGGRDAPRQVDWRELDTTCEVARSGEPGQLLACAAAALGVPIVHKAAPTDFNSRESRSVRFNASVFQAAMAGHAAAAMVLASRLAQLEGPGFARQASLWLEIAAHGGHELARLRILEAWQSEGELGAQERHYLDLWWPSLQASTDGATLKHVTRLQLDPRMRAVHDPTGALQTAMRIGERAAIDVEARELEATAYAINGRFDEAHLAARQAISLARKFDRDDALPRLKAAAKHYKAGRLADEVNE